MGKALSSIASGISGTGSSMVVVVGFPAEALRSGRRVLCPWEREKGLFGIGGFYFLVFYCGGTSWAWDFRPARAGGVMSCGSLWSLFSHGHERGAEVMVWVLFLIELRFGKVWIWTDDPEARCMFLLFPETK